MKMSKSHVFFLAVTFLSVAAIGCRPKTPAEKVQDKAEDLTHDAGQAIERAGDRIKDASK